MTDSTNKEPEKKVLIWLPLLLSLTLVGGMVIGVKLQPTPPQTQIIFQNEEKSTAQLGQGRIEELIRYIDAKYVDDVKSDEMVEKAINSLVKELDPHSNYISAESVKEVNEQLEGNFEGIGIEFLMLDDTIVVIAPTAGGPSEEVGIIGGDRIVTISDSIVAGVQIEIKDIVKKLRGKAGTKVDVGIKRRGVEGIKTFTVTRDNIPVNSVDIAYMLDDKTGYLKVNRFSASTYKEFMEQLERLVEEEQMQDLVIDLRQNPGGYLQEATKMLSQLFKEKDRLLVYTEGRSVPKNEYESTGQNFFSVDKITVLIDEGSASASEIVAGAIQDHDRGTIIGRRSFGKGLVQEQYSLKDGSALRLTVARYYTPSGRSIQRPYEEGDEYEQDLTKRYETGELSDSSKIVLGDTTAYYTKGGRKVYSGGGITPDLFVPIEDDQLNDYYISLRQHIPTFIYRYFDKNRMSLEEYSVKDFSNKFEISDKLLEEFITYTVEKEGVSRQPNELAKVKSKVKLFLKARIGKHLFQDEGFYRVINKEDKMVQKALQVLREAKPLVIK